MAISININDAAEMTDREITAMLAFLRTLGGECEQAPTVDEPQAKAIVAAPVVLHHITEPEAPVLVNMTDDEETVPATDLASVFGGTPAATVPTPAVQLDSAGLPWDARIHAASKATIADGTWRMRRNVDEAEVTRIEAELRAVLNGAPVVPAVPVAVPAVPVAVPAPAAPVVPAPAAPVVPPVPSVPPAPTPAILDWKKFLNVMTKHITEKRITTQQISEICRSLDLRHPGDLQIRPDQFPAFEAAVRVITGDAV